MLGMLRLPEGRRPAVTLAQVQGRPAGHARAPGEAFVPPGRNVAVFRDAEGVFAVSTVCTHLGCIVKTGPEGFDCPCHGSRFATDGSVTKGPAPRALAWRKVTGSGGAYVVDEGEDVPAGTKVKA